MKINPKFATRIPAAAAAVVMLAISSVSGAASLLTNGDAEAADVSGWTEVAISGIPATSPIIEASTSFTHIGGTATITPNEGSYFFNFAAEDTCSRIPDDRACGTTIGLQQTGTTGLVSGQLLELAGSVSTVTNQGVLDPGSVTLNLYNEGGVNVGSVTDAPLASANNSWIDFLVSLTVPSSAKTWEVILAGTAALGFQTNVYYDNVTLTAVPIPPAILLFGTAIAGLATLGRKRAQKDGDTAA